MYIEKLRLNSLRGKTLYWSKYVRIFCDGGYCSLRLLPRVHRMHYDPHWNMRGFWITFLGRQFFFSFGKDIHQHYDRNKTCSSKY